MRILQISALVSSLDRAAIAPLIVPIATDLSRSVGDVTLAATSYLLAYGVMQLVWAAASDKFGRVRTMRASLLVAGLAGMASAAAPNLTLLVATRGLAGATFAAAVPGALVYIGDTVPMRSRPAALADLATGIAAGFAVGTLGAALVAEQFNWRVPFVLTGAAALVLASLMGRLPEPQRESAPRLFARVPQLIRNRGTILILLLGFVEGFIVLGFLVFLPATLQLSGVSTSKAGGVTAVYGVAVILAASMVKRTAGRIAPHLVLGIGGLLVVLAFGLLAFAHNPLAVMISAGCLGGAWAQMHTALQAWATEVSSESRGLVVATFAAALFTGSAAGTWVGSLMLATGNLHVLFGAASGIAVLLTVSATLGRSRQPF